jgi:serine/threonine protein phosphatase PrpC
MVMTYSAFSATMTGGSHIKHGKECQDFSLHDPLYSTKKNSPLALAVVADGHGSEDNFRSARGAEIAAKCAAQALIDFVNFLEEPESPEPVEVDADQKKSGLFGKAFAFFLKNIQKGKPFPQIDTAPRKEKLDKTQIELCIRDLLLKHIVARWQITVEEDYTQNPFTPEELERTGEKHRKEYETGKGLYKAYGTTLIAVVITVDYWFGIHIGDGRFTALYKDGSFDQPVPWDARCFLNMTTSMCDDDAVARARIYFSFHAEKEPPCAMFLCSDGVDDNYPVDDNEKYLFKLYRTIALTFAEDGFDSTCGQIKDLANSFATKGKGDDTSIAGLIDMETVTQAAEVWRKQIAEEEAPPAKVEHAKSATDNAEPVQEQPLPVQPSAVNALTQHDSEQESGKSGEVEIQKGIAAYEQQKKLLNYGQEYGGYENAKDK